jgi:bifunctional DNase/RNase
MGEREADMVEVGVAHLGVERNTNTPIVVLQERDGERMIPIYIGHAEANAIAMELADVKFERPLTHDLMQQVIVGLGAELNQVVLTRVEKSTYYAELHLRRDDHVVQIDARPSDSIAIALRLKAPIFAAEDLLTATSAEEAVTPDITSEALDSDALKKYLENLDPEDFGKFTP